ncbi:MAG: hypothetical protein IJP61_13885 [Treponema sp.]|nr:hypothetical protein [Treponema sp.]
MKRILCFGDSNTWGYAPGSGGVPRLSETVRWTGRLQQELGNSCKILEFGLCGCEAGGKGKLMTFNSDARTIYPPVLFASLPVDVVIIMLGTNDIKTVNEWKHGNTAAGLRLLIGATRSLCSAKIVLASSVLLDERVLSIADFPSSAVADSALCAEEIEELSRSEGVLFFDTNEFVKERAEDGCHFTAASHAAFADGMAAFLRSQGLV